MRGSVAVAHGALVETTLQHPRRGFIKLEDTVAVTETGTRSMATAPMAGTAAGRAREPVASCSRRPHRSPRMKYLPVLVLLGAYYSRHRLSPITRCPENGPMTMSLAMVQPSPAASGIWNSPGCSAAIRRRCPRLPHVSVRRIGRDAWRITDEFFNGQIRGRVTFTLTRLDADHIEIKIAVGGASFRLRRC